MKNAPRQLEEYDRVSPEKGSQGYYLSLLENINIEAINHYHFTMVFNDGLGESGNYER